MKILQISLASFVLAASIFISGLTVDLVSAQNPVATTATTQRSGDLLRSKYLRFVRLTAEDGLSNDQVWGVAQDNHGIMWFATSDGLNRYSGSDFKVYRHDPDDPHSLSHDLIRNLILDQSGELWICTYGGLNQYDRERDAFIRYQHDPDDPHSLSGNIVRIVYEDRDGTIWVGTNSGLNKLDREKKQFSRYQHASDDPNSLSNNSVEAIVEDSSGVLWVGTDDGLNRFDPKTERVIRYRHNPDDPASLSHNNVRSICEESSGNLWVGTEDGLCKFNPKTTRFTRYQHDSDDPQSLSDNIAESVFIDQAGNLWVGTRGGGGLNRFDQETASFFHFRHDSADPYSLGGGNVHRIYEGRHGMLWIATDGGISIHDGSGKPFHHYRVISDNPNSLSNNSVRALHAGRTGVVWIGTNGGGLNKFDRQTEAFTHYQHDPADPNSLSNDAVVAVYEDRMGMVWVGTPGHGLSRFNPATERFTNYRHDADNPRSLSNDHIAHIYEDRRGMLWITTYRGGLNAFDRLTEQFIRYQHDPADPNTPIQNTMSRVIEDQAGALWIGTQGGLNKFDRETKTFTLFQHVSNDPHSLIHDSVISMHEDRAGTLWFGTLGGLEKYDRKNDRFTHYTTANGLPSNIIVGILEDEPGRLWLSTPKGLSRFDPRTETFRNYSVSDGLQSDTFLHFSAYSKSQSGEMFFGGSNGFNAFYPDQIADNPHPPPVLITDFQLAYKPVPIAADSVLKKSIIETDKLVLPYRYKVFSLEFSVLNYRAPEQNRYRYRMEGFETEWNDTDRTRRVAVYTNLDPGDYVFRAIGSNNDGVWNEEGASIRITIVPPWWASIWFRIAMGVVVVGLLAGGHRWRLSHLEARRRELEIREARFRATFEQVAVGMVHVASDGRILRANRKFCEIVGYPRNEVLARNFQNFIHPDDLHDYLEYGNRLLSGVAKTFSIQKRCLRKSTEIAWINLTVSLVRDEENRPKWFVAVIEDITEIRQVQNERNRILELSQDLICIAGMDGYFKYLNPAWETVLGYRNEELMSRNLLDFVHPDDRDNTRRELESLTAGRLTVDFENRCSQKGGGFRHLSWMATPLPNEQRVYAVARDITERKTVEKAFHQYQLRLKTLASQLTLTEEKERRRIAGDLHDKVSQSLALARVHIATFRRQATDPTQTEAFDGLVDTLHQTILDTRNVIYDLSPPQLTEIGLSSAVQDWLKKYVEERFGIRTEFTDKGRQHQLDIRLRSILFRNTRELVINAVKHAQAARVSVSLIHEENLTKIIVRDDGIGFHVDDHPTFDNIESSFGLFSIRETMAEVGGSLEILSEPGQGTEAVLSLPLA